MFCLPDGVAYVVEWGVTGTGTLVPLQRISHRSAADSHRYDEYHSSAFHGLVKLMLLNAEV